MATFAVKVNKLLAQAQNYDKDERYMATSDLVGELEAVEGVLDASLQGPIRNTVLKQLEDSSADVQSVAVKCLAVLVRKASIEQVVDIVDKLGLLVIDLDKKESRDIYAIGLKTIVGAVADSNGEAISLKLGKTLVNGLKNPKSDLDLEMTCLDIMKDLVARFGTQLVPLHDEIVGVVTPRLEHKQDAARKRASATLGATVIFLSDKAFNTLMLLVIERMGKVHSELQYTYIQTVGLISQAAGVRVGKYLAQIVPILERFCSSEKKEESNEVMIELRENCLQAFQSIILRCPSEVTPYVNKIVKLALEFVKYDPNYHYDDDDEKGSSGGSSGGKSGGGGGDDGDDKEASWDDDGDGGWGNDNEDGGQKLMEEGDDDSSWKVRRAAVRCLSAFIRARSDILKEYYETLCDVLVSRFKERDQGVKMAVFAACCDLLRESVVSKRESQELESMASPLSMPQLLRQRSSMDTLVSKAGKIITQIERELKKGNAETKKSALGVIRELMVVRQGNLGDYLSIIVPHVVDGVKSEDVRLKTEALGLSRLVVELHDSKELKKFVSPMAEAAVGAVGESYLKIKAEALRVCGAITLALDKSERELAKLLYTGTFGTILLKDMDQEVKEASLATIAVLVACFGDVLKESLKDCFPILVQRLTNEITRMSALRAITRIANSPLRVDLSPILEVCVKELCTFLRKDSQALRHETALTLEALVRSNGGRMSSDIFAALVKEVTAHVSDADLHLSHLVLDLLASIVTAQPATPGLAAVLDRVLVFVKSPLLQGNALQSVVKLFATLLSAKAKDLTYAGLVETLLGIVTPAMALQSNMVVAQCVAAMAKVVPAQEGNSTVQLFAKRVQETKEEHVRQIALLVLGEIGREKDFSEFKGIEDVVFNAFGNETDSVKQAAAFCLGNITVGNMGRYLPSLLELITKVEQQRYLLLSALKEVISRHSASPALVAAFKKYVGNVLPVLLPNAEAKEEGVRSMVAECLGSLAVIDGETIVPKMVELVKSTPNTRAVVITALRFALAPHNTALLRNSLPAFLALLKDENLHVRRQALLSVNALAHSNVDLLSPLLKELILPVLYAELQPKESLVRVVDLGPFKHRIDDGLPLRKAAFQCLETLLDVAPHRLDLSEYVKQIQIGLSDHDDIQILSYQILYNMAMWHGSALLEVLDELPDSIMKGVKNKLKEAKSEEPAVAEKAKDVLRSAVRSLSTINNVHNVEQCAKFTEFYMRVLKTALLAQMLKEMTER